MVRSVWEKASTSLILTVVEPPYVDEEDLPTLEGAEVKESDARKAARQTVSHVERVLAEVEYETNVRAMMTDAELLSR